MVDRSMRDRIYLCGGPQHAEYQQDAHERWQVGDGLEDRYEDQSAYAQPEDDVALHLRELADLGSRQVLCLVELTLQLHAENEGGNHHRDERWDEYLAEHALCGDDTLDPQHDGRHVTDRREGATAVGRYDDQCSIDQTVFTLLYQLAQHHNHHDRCRQVVEDGRQEEGHKGHSPQQLTLGARLHGVAHEVKTSIGVDDFYNGHGTHQEEQRATSIAQVVLYDFCNVVYHAAALYHRIVAVGVNHQQCPAEYAHQQGDGCLVDFCQTLQCNTQITGYENRNNTNC